MSRNSFAVLMALLLACGTARARDDGPFTAAELASWCDPYRHIVLKGHVASVHRTDDSDKCYGAFLTIQQLAATTFENPPVSILKTCIPPGASLTEFIQVFLRYTEEHPERGHEKFTDIALESLWSAYPCPTKSGPIK